MPDRQRDQHPPQRLCLALPRLASSRLPLADSSPALVVNSSVRSRSSSVRVNRSPSSVITPGLQQRDGGLVAEPLDVERAAAGDVKHPLPQLRRARPRSWGSGCRRRPPWPAPAWCRTPGTLVGITNSRSAPSRSVDHRAEHLGDDVAGLADHHGVADQHALALDLGRVVQRRQPDGGPGDLDRFHVGERGDPAGAADVDPDVEQLGGGLLGRVLVGDRPARARGTWRRAGAAAPRRRP